MNDNFATNTWGPEHFWLAPGPLPAGIELRRRHAAWLSARPGPRGQDTFEEVTLKTPAAEATLLVAYKAPLLAKDVISLKRRLLLAVDEAKRTHPDRAELSPAIFTDLAAPAVREAGRREQIGLVDQAGTVSVQAGRVFVLVEGHKRVRRPARADVFSGKSARVLRCLLAAPASTWQTATLADTAQVSLAYCYAVLTRLEAEGYVDRRSPRSGFRLLRPVELLNAWLDSDYRSAAAVEAFYAPSVSPADRAALAQALEQRGLSFAFTLMSATPDDAVFVGGAPHGLYLSGDISPVIDTLKLRRVTPHNFLILRPEPQAAVARGGVFGATRNFVDEPQLILDFVRHGGSRGREQAEGLLRRWADSLPLLARVQ